MSELNLVTLTPDQIGYTTKEGLVYGGISSYDGQYLYTTKVNFKVMGHSSIFAALAEINKNSDYKEYGNARTPKSNKTEIITYPSHYIRGMKAHARTCKISDRSGELVDNLYKNKNLIGGFETNAFMLSRRVWGSGIVKDSHYGRPSNTYNFLDFSDIYFSGAHNDEAALRPVWTVGHLKQ